jgi:nucleotide-binding universal stress UspA family protein
MSESRIIVGVDNSDSSLRAVRWAADEAARSGRDLVVTAVYNSGPIGAGLNPVGEPADQLRQIAEEIVAQAVVEVVIQAPEVRALGRTIFGPPGPVLAACGPADLLVVGNRGRGGFASLMLGSVGHHVVTHARSTVVVVRGHSDAADLPVLARADTTQHPVFAEVGTIDGPVVAGVDTTDGTVVAGVDTTDGPVVAGVDTASGDAVLRHAFEAADSRGVRLRAIHAYPPIKWTATFGYVPRAGGPDERQAMNHAALADLVHDWAAKFPQVPVDIVAVEGHPTAVLASASAMAQLVVVGHRRSGLGPVGLGAVAAQLLHHAQCPVMIVRTSVS